MGKVRWGVLSTASIGRLMIEATAQARAAEFVAVASRDAARARAFADELGLGRSFGSYEELLASDEVDAVYVALPVSMHAEWTVRSLQAGKHVLCEKPLALRVEDAERCFDAAATAGRLCAEGLMWRHHPRTTLARKLVVDGAIGRLASVRAALSVGVEPGDIRRRVDLGGGALGDLGCYCVSAIRLFAGEPERVWAEQVTDGPGGVDLRLAATLRLPGDVLAQFDVGLDLPRRDELELVGSEGRLTIPDPGCAAPTTWSWTATAASSGFPPTPAAPSPSPTPTKTSTGSSSTPPRPPSPPATSRSSAAPTPSPRPRSSRPSATPPTTPAGSTWLPADQVGVAGTRCSPTRFEIAPVTSAGSARARRRIGTGGPPPAAVWGPRSRRRTTAPHARPRPGTGTAGIRRPARRR
jgi:D-xylose 1-dehydrogenase (NADP+, D-xylono-1,5-lactone-forming)